MHWQELELLLCAATQPTKASGQKEEKYMMNTRRLLE
jgi:hypothetical protein